MALGRCNCDGPITFGAVIGSFGVSQVVGVGYGVYTIAKTLTHVVGVIKHCFKEKIALSKINNPDEFIDVADRVKLKNRVSYEKHVNGLRKCARLALFTLALLIPLGLLLIRFKVIQSKKPQCLCSGGTIHWNQHMNNFHKAEFHYRRYDKNYTAYEDQTRRAEYPVANAVNMSEYATQTAALNH